MPRHSTRGIAPGSSDSYFLNARSVFITDALRIRLFCVRGFVVSVKCVPL